MYENCLPQICLESWKTDRTSFTCFSKLFIRVTGKFTGIVSSSLFSQYVTHGSFKIVDDFWRHFRGTRSGTIQSNVVISKRRWLPITLLWEIFIQDVQYKFPVLLPFSAVLDLVSHFNVRSAHLQKWKQLTSPPLMKSKTKYNLSVVWKE